MEEQGDVQHGLAQGIHPLMRGQRVRTHLAEELGRGLVVVGRHEVAAHDLVSPTGQQPAQAFHGELVELVAPRLNRALVVTAWPRQVAHGSPKLVESRGATSTNYGEVVHDAGRR
jgi:hypothetical protein